MSKTDSPKLFRRSDGWYEDGNGNFAVVMKVSTRTVDGMKSFSYRSTFTSPPISVSWPENEIVSLFPIQVATGMVSRGYAREPLAEEVADMLVAPEPAKKAPKGGKDASPAPAPAPAPASPPSPPPSAPQGLFPDGAPAPAADPAAGTIDLNPPTAAHAVPGAPGAPWAPPAAKDEKVPDTGNPAPKSK